MFYESSRGSGLHFRPFVIVALFFLVGCDDTVTLTNTSGSESGFLIDGESSSGHVNDYKFIFSGTPVRVGQLSSSAMTNEVVAFTDLRPVAIQQPVAWTSGQDHISVSFSPRIEIPVTVWIVKGPIDAQRKRAVDACIKTAEIWNRERMGVAFNSFEIRDATQDPDALNYFDFDDCAKRMGLQNDIGSVPGHINIYYVEIVKGGTGKGHTCKLPSSYQAKGGEFVVLGATTSPDLLAHELGHDFTLEHPRNLNDPAHIAYFDETNVMHYWSTTRNYITEGQLFRTHLNTHSALNYLYGTRPGQPTKDCDTRAADAACPVLWKRIWADGAFPAN